MSTLLTVAAVSGGFGSGVAAAATLGAIVTRPLRRIARQNDDFREDWYGRAARPGVPAIPGMMERMAGIEGQLKPNGGGSLRDAVGRLDKRFDDQETRLTAQDRRLDAIERKLEGQ